MVGPKYFHGSVREAETDKHPCIHSISLCCPYNCIQVKCASENSHKLHAVNHHNQRDISLSHSCFLLTLAPGREIFDLQGEISLLHLRTAAFTRY